MVPLSWPEHKTNFLVRYVEIGTNKSKISKSLSFKQKDSCLPGLNPRRRNPIFIQRVFVKGWSSPQSLK